MTPSAIHFLAHALSRCSLKLMRIITPATFAILLAACGATVGHDFNFADTAKLAVGTSTVADAQALFGKPAGMNVANGTTYVMWMYGHSDFGGANAESRTLTLTFGPDGRYLGVMSMGAGGAASMPVPAASAPAK